MTVAQQEVVAARRCSSNRRRDSMVATIRSGRKSGKLEEGAGGEKVNSNQDGLKPAFGNPGGVTRGAARAEAPDKAILEDSHPSRVSK